MPMEGTVYRRTRRGRVQRLKRHTNVQMNHWDEMSWLHCPRCREEGFLHQVRVTVYDRGEDAEETEITVVQNGLSATHIEPSEGCGNPSSRRQGLAIEFECELCEGPLELTIAQHKGNTHLYWRFE